MSTKVIAWITGTLTLLLALFSFVLSFNALTELAAEHNVSIPYLFPLVVEAGVIIFSLNALHRSLHGEHARWQWVLIIGSSLAAGTLNILHADPDPVSRFMAAMPSLFLLLSFESFLNQLKHTVTRSGLTKRHKQLTSELEQKQTELDIVAQELDKLHDQLEQVQAKITLANGVQHQQLNRQVTADQTSLTTEHRRSNLVDILAQDQGVAVSTLAKRLNASRTTIYNDLDTLRQKGVVRKNGRGWEVIQ